MSLSEGISIIDAHVHIESVGGAKQIAEVMEAAGFQGVCGAGLTARGGSSTIQNDICLLLKLLQPAKAYAFGGLHYNLPGIPSDAVGLASQAEALLADGFDGIKMIEGKPSTMKALGRPLNSPSYDEFYSLLESSQTPLLFHVADPETFWDAEQCPQWARNAGWFWGDGTFPTKQALHSQVDDILNRHPKLRIIFAHFYFGSTDVEEARRFLDRWPNVSFDITPHPDMYDHFSQAVDVWRDFFTNYQDRILFGTDTPYPLRHTSMQKQIECFSKIRRFLETDAIFAFNEITLRGLALDRDALAKIYAGNFCGFVGSEPKQVSVSAATARCERMIKEAQSCPDSDNILPGLREVLEELGEL